MADTPRRRPVVGSRNPTARPRRVAGQSGASAASGPVEHSGTTEQPESPVEPVEPVDPTPDTDAPDEYVIAPQGSDDPSDEQEARHGLLGSLVTTAALVIALVLLIGAAAGEAWYLWGRDEPAASAQRPVVTGTMTYRSAVDTATRDTEDILSTSYRNYDAQVAQATSRMTPTFAKKYQATVADIQDQFVTAKTEVQVKAVAAGVVRASSDEVQTLLFLNQYVSKGGKHTVFTPYRALVTLVHTSHGWLVSDIATQ